MLEIVLWDSCSIVAISWVIDGGSLPLIARNTIRKNILTQRNASCLVITKSNTFTVVVWRRGGFSMIKISALPRLRWIRVRSDPDCVFYWGFAVCMDEGVDGYYYIVERIVRPFQSPGEILVWAAFSPVTVYMLTFLPSTSLRYWAARSPELHQVWTCFAQAVTFILSVALSQRRVTKF